MVDIQTILSGVLSTVAIGCLGVIAKTAGQYGGKIVKEVWAWIECKAKASNLEYVLKEAKVIWYQVEEDFRIQDQADKWMNSKADEFDRLLMKKFPNITQAEMNGLRQSIAGEYNKDKVSAIANTFNLKVADSDPINPVDTTGWMSEEEAYKIQADNDELKKQLQTANDKLNGIAKAMTISSEV